MILSILISIFNIASVYFAAKNNRLTWMFGIFAALLTSYIMYDIMMFQGIFQILTAIFCGYSFIRWKSNSEDNDNDVHLSNIISCFLLVWLIPLISILLFEKFINDNIDLMLTSLSFYATILLYRKNVFAWIVWIIVDIGFIASSITLDNNAILLIYLIMFFLACYGFIRNINLVYKNDKTDNIDKDIEYLLKL